MFKPISSLIKTEGKTIQAFLTKSKDKYYHFKVNRSSLTLSFNTRRGQSSLELLNSKGKILEISSSSSPIDRNVKAGTYYLRLRSSKKTSFSLFTNKGNPINTSTELEAIHLTNIFRDAQGLSPLVNNYKLATIAYLHSYNMASQDFYSHSYQGMSSGDRADKVGYKWTLIAENIAAGQASSSEVVQAWIDSPGHRANLVRPELKDIGIGYFFIDPDIGNINYNRYWTQNLGTTL